MGGRGISSGANSRQITMEQLLFKEEIASIIGTSNKMREANKYGAGGSSSPLTQKRCACCMQFSIPKKSRFATCPICNWIDDPYQNTHPLSLEGKNPISLEMAKEQYRNQFE